MASPHLSIFKTTSFLRPIITTLFLQQPRLAVKAAGIKSIQQLAETLLERLLNLALQVQGIAARVRFRFAELRAAELLRDAQVELLQTTIARMKYDNGSISADEMVEQSCGKAKADSAQPRDKAGTSGATGAVAGAQPDPGSNRDAKQDGHRTFTRDVMAMLGARALR